MKPTLKITGSDSKRLDSVTHAFFHDIMYSLFDKADRELIPFPNDIMQEWRRCIDIETDLCREARVRIETAIMKELDEERIRLIKYIFRAVRNERHSFVSTKKEAADRLVIIVDSNKGLEREPIDKKYVLIEAMIDDFKDEKHAPYTKTLGLDDTLAQLEEVNEAHVLKQRERSNNQCKKNLPNSKKVRPQTDMAYLQLCTIIEASYLLATDAAAEDRIKTLMLQINRRISEIKANFHKRQGHKPVENEAEPEETPPSELSDEQEKDKNIS